MSQIVVSKIIKRLGNVFGAPNCADPEEFFAEYQKAFTGYSADVLQSAVDRVMKEHVYASWPTVGEVMAAVQAVLAARSTGHAPEHVKFSALGPEPGKKYVNPERLKELMSSFSASFEANNDFPAIMARCPIKGKINVSAPWGEEVTDKDGNIVPIREKKKRFA